jgi:hypothetical protein
VGRRSVGAGGAPVAPVVGGFGSSLGQPDGPEGGDRRRCLREYSQARKPGSVRTAVFPTLFLAPGPLKGGDSHEGQDACESRWLPIGRLRASFARVVRRASCRWLSW